MQPSKLQHALRQGLEPGGNLADELFRLGDYKIATVDDAHAVCEALEKFPLVGKRSDEFFKDWTPLHAVTALFQQVESEEAFAVLFEHGIPHLLRLFDEMIDSPGDDADALLFILKILGMYQSTEGAARVVEAARKPLLPDSYIWSVIFEQFEEDHPYLPWLCRELSDPLPEGFVAVALLDTANQACLEGWLSEHPFDTPQGTQQLEAWLTKPDPDEFSFAASAAVALPFISPPQRDRLLALALDHADPKVQLEAAWASASLGSAAGIKYLRRLCLEPGTSATACSYLRELGRENVIPAAAMEPNFLAMSDLCTWLSHPNEYGRPPDEIELLDTRAIYWPPTDDRRRVWLFKFRYEEIVTFDGDQERVDVVTGIGMVGSVTFALSDIGTAELTPLDLYALHCCWELEVNKDSRAPRERSVQAGRELLAQYNDDLDSRSKERTDRSDAK
jgi:hypothetical protein